MPGMQTSHQSAPGRRANRSAGVALGETHALRSQTINIRRVYHFLPVASEVAVTEVVSQYENDVRFALGSRPESFGVRRCSVRNEQAGQGGRKKCCKRLQIAFEK